MIRNINPDIILHIDHNQATIYSLTSPDNYDTQIITPDNLPQYRHPSNNGNQNHIPTRPAQKSQGSKTPKAPINPQYFQDITHAIAHAPHIIILSRGTGKSNAANHLINHLKSHNPEIIPRIVANRTIDHPTTNQLVANSRQILRQHQPVHHNI
ncbi:hypothetical protein JD969_07525 [Planctomycetota bacterium]|nr:hypothetical protein JD969_07525 [Planctomycetota bacterium]